MTEILIILSLYFYAALHREKKKRGEKSTALIQSPHQSRRIQNVGSSSEFKGGKIAMQLLNAFPVKPFQETKNLLMHFIF